MKEEDKQLLQLCNRSLQDETKDERKKPNHNNSVTEPVTDGVGSLFLFL
jgi:hypothetical protein